MGRFMHSRLHNRLWGLKENIKKMIDNADSPGRQMSKRERSDLAWILSLMNKMLEDDKGMESPEPAVLMPCRNSDQILNTQCEFFDLDANRIQCAIGCDMYSCSRKCIYATNVPGTLPPYCTKYMKGWIERI